MDPCQQTDRFRKHEEWIAQLQLTRHGVFEWLMISASISVLILVFHVYSSVKQSTINSMRMVEAITSQNEMVIVQNEILRDIRDGKKGGQK